MDQQMSQLADDDAGSAELFEPASQKNRSEQELPPPEDLAEIDPGAVVQPLFNLEDNSAGEADGFTKWQSIIWREWSRCEDEGYAYYLFDLIKNTTFGWKFIVTVAVLGTLLGALLGYAVGAIMARGGLYFGPLNLTNLPPILLGFLTAVTGGLIGLEGSRRFRALYFWWQGQPSSSLVEKALHQAVAHNPAAGKVWAKPLQRLAQEKKQPGQPDPLIKMLAGPNWVDRFVAQKTLVASGGTATPALKKIAQDEAHRLQKVGLWLLGCIEQETANKFAWRAESTLCPHCLTRFAARPVEVGIGVSFTYYGCRVCGQSRDYLYLPHGVVALLDTSSKQKLAEKEGRLRVNWSVKRTMFDFDWVAIAHASDEDVERFAVQVGNDTDPWRSARYRQMKCFIAANCQLSENTLRVLQHTFGQVKQAKRKTR